VKILPPDWTPYDPNPGFLLVGERPGGEEHETDDDDPYRNFIGPAGQELWDRMWRTCHVTRDAFTVCNLVPTFSVEPPSEEEIHEHAWRLRAVLQRVRPTVIVTVGYHAARWFLPQFVGVTGDKFHGLPFAYTYGRLEPHSAIVVPCCHSAAALREPERYQTQLTDDLRAVARVLAGSQGVHTPSRPTPARIGLAGFRPFHVLGLDTEGTDTTECLTLAFNLQEAALVEEAGLRVTTVRSTVEQAKAVVIHSALADWPALARVGIDLNRVLVHDTMLQAYLLGHPQALKTLMYRLAGYDMQDYLDLVTPVDSAAVLTTLRRMYEKEKARLDREAVALKDAKHRAKHRLAHAGRRRDVDVPARSDSPGRDGRGDARADREGGFTRRALSSVARILTKDAAASPRERWEASKFQALIPLPPPATWASLPAAVGVPYAMADAVAHLHAYQLQMPMIRERGLLRTYEIDRGILPFLARNQQIGMKVDEAALPRLSQKFTREFDAIVDRLSEMAGHAVNPLAPAQVSEFLFEELDVRRTRRKKSGAWSTEKKHLKARETDHEAVPLIMEARHLSKLRGTYTERLPGMLREGRYHPDWRYTRTKTGRAAEEIILLIPKHSPYSKLVRNCFIADDGHVLLSLDLSQIELRVFAHDSKDARMCAALRRGDDLHAITAHEVLGGPKHKADQDEDLHRHPSKTYNFSVIMGTTAYGLNDQMQARRLPGWSVERAQRTLDEWFKYYAGGKRYLEARKAEARRFGYVTNMFGFRIPCDGVWSTNEKIRTEAERLAHSGPVQSAACHIAKMWIRRTWKHVIKPRIDEGRRYCEPWVWVHDDISIECDERIQRGVAREALALVPDVLRVPTLAEAKVGQRWAAMKELDN